jgi:hypothetical protein
MKDLETKQKVLEEIMSLMDEKEGDKLKSHPKLMAAKIEIGKPKSEDGEDPAEELSESPLDESKEHLLDEKPKDEEEVDPEMLKKLIEMMNSH